MCVVCMKYGDTRRIQEMKQQLQLWWSIDECGKRIARMICEWNGNGNGAHSSLFTVKLSLLVLYYWSALNCAFMSIVNRNIKQQMDQRVWTANKNAEKKNEKDQTN